MQMANYALETELSFLVSNIEESFQSIRITFLFKTIADGFIMPQTFYRCLSMI